MGVSISSHLADASTGLSSACISAANTLPHQLVFWTAAAGAALCKGMGHERSDPRPGAWAGRPLEDVLMVGAQGVKKLHLLVGFWVGLRNSFTALLFHTTFLIGSTLDFITYLTFLKNFSKVEWIWAAAGPIFQHLYFQLYVKYYFKLSTALSSATSFSMS